MDTGIGGGAIAELPIGSFPQRLAEAGVAPEDVDVVIFTHLHFDHVGWSTDGGSDVPPRGTPRPRDRLGVLLRTDPHAETGPGRDDFGAIPAPERLAPLADTIVLHDGERRTSFPG